MGSDGDAFTRIPTLEAIPYTSPTALPARATAVTVRRTPLDRPSRIIQISLMRVAVERSRIGAGRVFRHRQLHSRPLDDVAASDDHLMHSAGDAVLRSELSLLDGALNEQVLALLVG